MLTSPSTTSWALLLVYLTWEYTNYFGVVLGCGLVIFLIGWKFPTLSALHLDIIHYFTLYTLFLLTLCCVWEHFPLLCSRWNPFSRLPFAATLEMTLYVCLHPLTLSVYFSTRNSLWTAAYRAYGRRNDWRLVMLTWLDFELAYDGRSNF